MEDGTYLQDRDGQWVPVVQSAGYYVARRPLTGTNAPLAADEYLGVWTDPGTGHVYFDATEHIEDLTEALIAAEVREELAIWDIARGAEILTTRGLQARIDAGQPFDIVVPA